MIKRFITASLALSLLISGAVVVSAPVSAGALSADQCFKYNGDSYSSPGDDLTKFKKTNCVKDRYCKISYSTNSAKITCSKKKMPKPKPKKDDDSSTISAQAGGLSTSCRNANDICLRDLPRPANTGGGIVQTILQITIGIIAALSVLFVAIGGLRYIMSQGDPQGVSKAKSTIVYALIGLVIALLAQGLVILVIKAVS